MAKEVLAEARLIDFHDEQLKEYLGGTYQTLKDREEAKKRDGEIEKMVEALKEYKNRMYDVEIKSLKAQLKAARSVAKARGIVWHMPKDGNG